MVCNAMPSLQLIRVTIAALLPSGDLSLRRTAWQLGINPRSLQRHLAGMGTSYSEQVMDVRLKRACQLLEKTNMRVSEIAAELGFAHASGFSRAFIRRLKVQPRIYRQR